LILALAGLYGTGRDPAGWLKRGLIKNAHSFINLIHVSDVVKIIRCWLEIPLSGIRLNVSDGRHRRWHELAEQLVNCGTLQKESTHFLSDVPTVQSKRVNNSELVRQLYSGPFHAYPEDGL
jgi:nucleoside-diphosphate-sugar epimerase